jgi:hypothetical protein
MIANDDSITIEGDSVEDVFVKCVQMFPQGIKSKGFLFSGSDLIDARRNFCELVILGLEMGYFSERDFGNFDDDDDDNGNATDNL